MNRLAPRAIALALASAFAFSACANAATMPPRAQTPYLSQDDAAARAARVSNVD